MAKQTKKVNGNVRAYLPDGKDYSFFCEGTLEITEGKKGIVYSQKIVYKGAGRMALPKGTKIGNKSLEEGIVLDPFACIPDSFARTICESLGCYNRNKK